MAARACGFTTVQRESFDYTSLAGDVFQWAAENGQRLGLVGGKPGVSIKAAKELKVKYPGLEIAACYTGYGQDPDEAQQFFIQHQVELVICGMGAPLQERFLLQLVKGGWHGAGFTCGGFLDQVNKGDAYYPVWIDRFNIRFLYRLFKEPGRLWRRYLVEYQVFLRRYCQLQWTRVKLKIKGGSKPDNLK